MRWWHVLLVLIGIGMILQASLPAGAAVPKVPPPIEPVAVVAPLRPACITLRAVVADTYRRAERRNEMVVLELARSGAVTRAAFQVWGEREAVIFVFVDGCLVASRLVTTPD